MAKSIEFFLSGAQHPDTPQKDINQSLGGYISSTPIPKNLINSLFSTISNKDLVDEKIDTLAIFLKNTGTEDIQNLNFTQVYESKLGKKTNLCKFEWGFVIPQANNCIELIGSKNENPFYVEFEEPELVRENCILKITNPGQIGDDCFILGVDFTLSGNSKNDVVKSCVEAFKNNQDWLVEEYSEDEIFIQSKNENFTNDTVELVTTGNSSSNSVTLQGQSNSLEIQSISIGSTIGVWIRRTVLKNEKCDINSDTNKVEELEVIINFD